MTNNLHTYMIIRRILLNGAGLAGMLVAMGIFSNVTIADSSFVLDEIFR